MGHRFWPNHFGLGPKNSTKGRGIKESTGNSQIAKLLASQEKISRGGVLRHVMRRGWVKPVGEAFGMPDPGEHQRH